MDVLSSLMVTKPVLRAVLFQKPSHKSLAGCSLENLKIHKARVLEESAVSLLHSEINQKAIEERITELVPSQFNADQLVNQTNQFLQNQLSKQYESELFEAVTVTIHKKRTAGIKACTTVYTRKSTQSKQPSEWLMQ